MAEECGSGRKGVSFKSFDSGLMVSGLVCCLCVLCFCFSVLTKESIFSLFTLFFFFLPLFLLCELVSLRYGV